MKIFQQKMFREYNLVVVLYFVVVMNVKLADFKDILDIFI